jgi:SEC-C motif-containing protein
MTTHCPCYSLKAYANCCEPLHKGAPAANALELMRSRYSAYSLGLVQYIIQTSHPLHPDFKKDPLVRQKEILDFCQKTQFEGLDILEFTDGEKVAFVTFKAHLRQGSKEASFQERSRFQKEEGRWLYVSGVMAP